MKFSLKERCKTYSFWFAILSALVLLVQAIGEPLGLTISQETYISVINAVLGVFVVFGIISDPTDKTTTEETTTTGTTTEETTETTDEDADETTENTTTTDS